MPNENRYELYLLPLKEQIQQTWDRIEIEADRSRAELVKYLMLTNSGGAIALLSFMGASVEMRGQIATQIALVLFLIGLILTGFMLWNVFITSFANHTKWFRDLGTFLDGEIEQSELSKRIQAVVANQEVPNRLSKASFALFISGCVIGRYSLLF